MNKYGVHTDKEEKTAAVDAGEHRSAEISCPLCGRRVRREGSVLLCTVHGSKPFEK